MIYAFARTLPGSPRSVRTLRGRHGKKDKKAPMSPTVVLTRHQLNSAILAVAICAFVTGAFCLYIYLVLSGKVAG